MPTGGKIRHSNLAHHMAQPWRNFHSRGNCCLLNSLMEVGCDIEVEMAHRTLGIALVEGSCLLTAEASPYDVTYDHSPWLAEVLGQVIYFTPRRWVKASIHANAGAWLVRWWSRWCVHPCPAVSMASMRECLASLIPIDYDRDRSRLCKTRSTSQSW